MKTKNACFWIFLLLSGSAYAQMSQKGTVQIFNSNKSPLPGVQLTATDAPATDTDANGNFQFNFSKQKPGMAIASPNVYKKGYELVNKDMINGWILSEKRPLSIVMAPEGTIEESKNKYYSISVAHFSKKQEKAIEEINQLYIAQKISLQERSDRLKAMAEESRSFMNQIDQYAEKFARINPDDINAIEKHGHWKDAAIMLKGKAAWSFTLIFLQTWEICTHTDEDYEIFYPWKEQECPVTAKGFVQPYADSPMDEENVGEHVYLHILNNAKKYVYINTPYLIVDDSMLSALRLAAKSGVDIRIITPHRWDKWWVHMTTRSYYRELIKSGVKIYE